MKCPRCGDTPTQVIDSRTAADGEVVRRRRQCVSGRGCPRFTTYEIPGDAALRFTLEIDLKGKVDVHGGDLRVKLAEDDDAGPT